MQRSQFPYGVLMFGDGSEVNTKVYRTNHKCAKGRRWGALSMFAYGFVSKAIL